jgi:DNA replication protein DnaC
MMNAQQTIDKLNWFKVCTMAEEYRRQLSNPEISTLSFDDRFGLLVDSEWTARQNKRLANLVRRAGMKYNCAIEEIIYSPDRNIDKQMMLQLSTCTWIIDSLNVIITGATGTGKTFVGCALGNAACRNSFKVLFKRVPRLLTDLAISKGDGTYNKLMKELKKVKLLILDDWGINNFDPAEGRDILEVIEDRNQVNSTVILSQLSVSDWHPLFSDPIVADAVMDRIIHGSHIIELTSNKSMRGYNYKNTTKKETP